MSLTPSALLCQLWLPLTGGSLRCRPGGSGGCNSSRIVALAWDSQADMLYIGGTFNAIGDTDIAPGDATWPP